MLSVFVLVFLLSGGSAHVALLFPQARDLSLDFLDNVRTAGPCGMPKGESLMSLRAGATLNVSWHLGYPHQGGFRIDLLGPDDTVLQSLTPVDGGSRGDGWLDADPTAQSYPVTLPTYPCARCAIRLRREAREWEGGYQFWSCGDVDIEDARPPPCSGKGQTIPPSGKCACDPGYTGDLCQFKLGNCEVDADCYNDGQCVEMDMHVAVEKVCFCKMGFFGKNCEKESPINEKITDLSGYQRQAWKDKFELYWKTIWGNEIEIVMKAKTKSYVSVGWQPVLLDQKCNKITKKFDGTEDLEYLGGSKKRGDTSSSEEGTSSSEEGKNTSSSEEAEGEPRSSSEESHAEGEAEPEGEKSSEESHAEGEYSSEEAGAEGEPEGEPEGEAEAEAEPEAEYLFPMDCADYVIGMARGDLSRVYDAYSRDRSTPLPDEMYGGTDDLTAAIGYEENGETVVAFRKPLVRTEAADHSVPDEVMQVLWAFGQEEGMYSHRPESGLEAGNPSVENFYGEDQVKYHGRANRGHPFLNFMSEVTRGHGGSSGADGSHCELVCMGEKDGVCQYAAKWSVQGEFAAVEVSSVVNEDEWVGIGFSEDQAMPDSDIVVGFFRDGQPVIYDMWASGYGQPEVDEQQDIEEATLERKDGVTTLKFKKRIGNPDGQDLDLGKPVFAMYPTTGGPVTARGNGVGRHYRDPRVSADKVVLTGKC